MSYARTNEKWFDLGKGLKAHCWREKTRYGFRHLAFLHSEAGGSIAKAKACYYNRTWESYEYESVLRDLVRKGLSGEERAAATKALDAYAEPNPLCRGVAAAAAMASILCDKPEDANAVKRRLIATVPGISFPDDFDALPEAEKSRRLDGVLKVMREP